MKRISSRCRLLPRTMLIAAVAVALVTKASALAQGLVESRSGLPLDPARLDVFLCGNPEMIREVKHMLTGRGFVRDEGRKPGTIHVEEYW